MFLPQIPAPVIIGIPLLFIFLLIFTDIRYELKPIKFVGHVTTIAALSIGFVFLYALQKYDKMDANFPVIVRNIIFLADIALEHDPSLICFLIQYLVDFLNFNNSGFPIINFEKKILTFIDDENEIFRIREAVTILEDLSFQRISGENLIPAAVWYAVFLVTTILTIIFPMDTNIDRAVDSILLILLIWVPIVTVYILYLDALSVLDNAIKDLLGDLKKLMKREGINCCKVLEGTDGDIARANRNRFTIDLLIGQ